MGLQKGYSGVTSTDLGVIVAPFLFGSNSLN